MKTYIAPTSAVLPLDLSENIARSGGYTETIIKRNGETIVHQTAGDVDDYTLLDLIKSWLFD